MLKGRHRLKIYAEDFASYFAVGLTLELFGMLFLEFAPFDYLSWQQILWGALSMALVFAFVMTLYVSGAHERILEKMVSLTGVQRI